MILLTYVEIGDSFMIGLCFTKLSKMEVENVTADSQQT